ncbi:hypothetical protein [Duganella sp. P38]|uniref:hypothetical protein n=1 Tax=Duganella sp. P38 TaxID=3423949 RepID=UPI003D791E95
MNPSLRGQRLHIDPENQTESFGGNRRTSVGIQEVQEFIEVAIEYRDGLDSLRRLYRSHSHSFMHYLCLIIALFCGF